MDLATAHTEVPESTTQALPGRYPYMTATYTMRHTDGTHRGTREPHASSQRRPAAHTEVVESSTQAL
eukprot:3590457-Alexandrium_andersonii.AAC.1